MQGFAPTETPVCTKRMLHRSSFFFLNVAQFIGAMNDNVFKLLLAYFLIYLKGPDSSVAILSMAGAIYVLPFLLLSTVAGVLADHYSKSHIIVATRIAELLILLLGMLAFFVHSPILSFATLFLLASHSAIFGPCKYGIIPEIVPSQQISHANGLLTSFSYIAIIVGTFLASFLTEITNRNFILALLICCCFSAISIVAALQIRTTSSASPRAKTPRGIAREVIQTIRIINSEPSLLSAVLGSSFFLFVGSFVQLNMIPYAIQVLHITDVQGGYIFLLTAVGIGIGSIVAGKISGKFIEFGLVPIAGLSMSLCCFLLDFYSGSIPTVLALTFLVGFFGGMYLVPLDSYVQVASPKTHRGQVVAAVNFLGFCFVLLSALSLYIISHLLSLPPDTGFTIIGFVTLSVALIITVSMYGYCVRFVSFLISTLLCPRYLQGKEIVPLDRPSLFLVPQSMWPWAIVLLASQRRRMRIFLLSDQTTPPLPSLLRRLVYISTVSHLAELFPTGTQAEILRHSFERGISIAIFCSKKIIHEHGASLCQEWAHYTRRRPLGLFVVSVPEEGGRTGKEALCAHIEAVQP